MKGEIQHRNIKPYHFTKSISENFISFYHKIIQSQGIICFDFEDSITIPNKKHLATFKTKHRKNIIQALEKENVDYNFIGFRINNTDSDYYSDDISAIHSIKNIHCVFLPKVENSFQIEKASKDLPLSIKNIIPIIETKDGFSHIKEILSYRDTRFTTFAFGHCDYNLSNGYFPFYHQKSNKYWEWIAYLSHFSEMYEKKLINSPVLSLDDDELFQYVMKENRTDINITGQITMCLKQTFLCANANNHYIPNSTDDIFYESDKYKKAKEIVANFEKNKLPDRFFAIDKKRVLICPQEYELAKSIINNSHI
jgi:citrate lyase beta subunit